MEYSTLKSTVQQLVLLINTSYSTSAFTLPFRHHGLEIKILYYVPHTVRGAARENGVLCLKDTALGAASVLECLLANIALCPATPEIRHLFTADTWSSGQTSQAQGNVIWCKK